MFLCVFIKTGNKTENPYNKELLNKSILDTLRNVIKLSKHILTQFRQKIKISTYFHWEITSFPILFYSSMDQK